MKVRELIAQLQHLDPEAEVFPAELPVVPRPMVRVEPVKLELVDGDGVICELTAPDERGCWDLPLNRTPGPDWRVIATDAQGNTIGVSIHPRLKLSDGRVDTLRICRVHWEREV